MVITLSHCLVFVKMNNRRASPRPEPTAVFGEDGPFAVVVRPAPPWRTAGRALARVARSLSLHSGLLCGLKSAPATRGGTP